MDNSGVINWEKLGKCMLASDGTKFSICLDYLWALLPTEAQVCHSRAFSLTLHSRLLSFLTRAIEPVIILYFNFLFPFVFLMWRNYFIQNSPVETGTDWNFHLFLVVSPFLPTLKYVKSYSRAVKAHKCILVVIRSANAMMMWWHTIFVVVCKVV